jgi:hypothetical protein
MIQRYNTRSLALGLPGFVIQVAGGLVVNLRPEHADFGNLLAVAGTGLLMAGLAYYAMAKGRHPAWCLMAFFSLLGFIILGLLKDHSDYVPAATPSPAPRARAGRPPARPATFPDSAPGHDFNAYGVCNKCGCGRSAANRPCVS